MRKVSVPDHLVSIIDQFENECGIASYHFADDSGKEWGKGLEHSRLAQKIYDGASDEAKAIMEAVHKGYLNSLKI